jgi:hypothetical protein
MADEKNGGAEGIPEGNDSGLGNLPPLSDFDSTAEETSDSGLPPLGDFDSGSPGGLPPIEDIPVADPQPTGGAVKPPPASFETPDSDAFSSGSTPQAGESVSDSGFGFQDLAADSDFSPETPEIGPGPSPGPTSDMDTPMFDSAFGDDNATQADTPTQAMETPMFGEADAPAGGGGGFDAGGFGADVGGGAPQSGGIGDNIDMGQARVGGGNLPPQGGTSKLLVIGVAVVALIIGAVLSPYLATVLPFLNPAVKDLAAANTKITGLEGQIATLRGRENPQDIPTPEKIAELEKTMLEKEQALKIVEGDLATTTSQLSQASTDFDNLKVQATQLSGEFDTAQSAYEQVKDESFLVDVRLRGLYTELDRLTSLVGKLEGANVRRTATKDALLASVDRLIIQVREGIPLTPKQFNYKARLAAATDLRAKVDAERWVTPALLNAYTSIYVKELQISASEAYFFAKLPTEDLLGNRELKWSECVMEGNQAVYYRSLDGLTLGVYRNTGTTENPSWNFLNEYDEDAQLALSAQIAAYRVEGFEEKVQTLLGEEVGMQKKESKLQRLFSSL